MSYKAASQVSFATGGAAERHAIGASDGQSGVPSQELEGEQERARQHGEAACPTIAGMGLALVAYA